MLQITETNILFKQKNLLIVFVHVWAELFYNGFEVRVLKNLIKDL